MAIVKSYDELNIGDQFLTEDWNDNPIKLTVSEKIDGLVLTEELGGIDISLEQFYVTKEAQEVSQ